MKARAALAGLLVAGSLSPAAFAAAPAAKAKPAPKAAPKKPAADEPAKAAAGEDPDLASSGKVIEIDGSGNAKVVKGEQRVEGAGEAPPPAAETKAAPPAQKAPGDFDAVEACKLRFKGQCTFLARCSGDAFPVSCDELTAVCDQLSGPAAYSRKDGEACAKGLAALACSEVSAQGLAFDPEAKVPACKPVREAESADAPAPAKGSQAPRPLPAGAAEIEGLGVDIGNALGGGDP